MDRRLNSKKQYKGLVVFDVDGVIFRNIFLIRVARSTGLSNYIRTLFLGWRYYTNGINFKALFDEGLKLIRDFDAQKALNIAEGIRRSSHIEQTMRILHERGYFISLISSGIPNYILSQLTREIGADHFSGLDTGIKNGKIQVDQLSTRPKDEIVGELLLRLNLTWNDVASVVDDPNNLTLMKKSRFGVGFNPSRIIRTHADIVVDGYDMLEIIPHIVPENQLPEKISLRKQLYKRELYRKTIHFLGVPLPFLAYVHKPAVAAVLSAVILIYVFAEATRTIGFHLPFISHITKRSERITETRGFIIGPVSLTAGILITLFAFSPEIYIPAILIVCISDSVSSLVGRSFGKLHLPFFDRTLEGSIAFYITSLAILLFFLPPQQALLTALVPTVLELVTPHYLDNLLIPIGTALLMKYVVG
jgi:dolichol kinase/phosphoserine phosphatase